MPQHIPNAQPQFELEPDPHRYGYWILHNEVVDTDYPELSFDIERPLGGPLSLRAAVSKAWQCGAKPDVPVLS